MPKLQVSRSYWTAVLIPNAQRLIVRVGDSTAHASDRSLRPLSPQYDLLDQSSQSSGLLRRVDMQPQILGIDTLGVCSVKGTRAASHLVGCGLLDLANRQRVILTVHLRLNMLSLANASNHPGGVVDLHTHLITVILFDEIGTGFNTPHFALNCVETI